MVKKVTRKTTKPMIEETTACCDGCRCHGGFWSFVKKLVIFVIVFALGFAAAKFIPCPYMDKMMRGDHGPREEMFVNGCFDIAKISCPEKAQKIAMADVNRDGCITKDELSALKQDGKCGCDNGDCGCNKNYDKPSCGCNKCGEPTTPSCDNM